jgi:hypothetical protein
MAASPSVSSSGKTDRPTVSLVFSAGSTIDLGQGHGSALRRPIFPGRYARPFGEERRHRALSDDERYRRAAGRRRPSARAAGIGGDDALRRSRSPMSPGRPTATPFPAASRSIARRRRSRAPARCALIRWISPSSPKPSPGSVTDVLDGGLNAAPLVQPLQDAADLSVALEVGAFWPGLYGAVEGFSGNLVWKGGELTLDRYGGRLAGRQSSRAPQGRQCGRERPVRGAGGPVGRGSGEDRLGGPAGGRRDGQGGCDARCRCLGQKRACHGRGRQRLGRGANLRPHPAWDLYRRVAGAA